MHAVGLLGSGVAVCNKKKKPQTKLIVDGVALSRVKPPPSTCCSDLARGKQGQCVLKLLDSCDSA